MAPEPKPKRVFAKRTLPPLLFEQNAPIPPPVSAPARVIVSRLSTKLCCWPIGTPRDANFRFCNVNALPSKPYCDAHAAIAYVRVRDRREDAA